MRFYKQVQDTPIEAQKPYDNGRFKGTDINPMWRIKMLTQMFGPAGLGWWTENEQFNMVPSPDTGEIAVFCQLKLRYRDPETGEVSQPVFGVGGNRFLVSQKSGKYCSDEAYKMAYTDALSIACKALGFSHDIYYAKDRTKYSMYEDQDGKPGENKGNQHTDETVDLINKIQERLTVIGRNMSKEEKNDYADKVIKPVLGTPAFKTCSDTTKLNKLLDVLNKAA